MTRDEAVTFAEDWIRNWNDRAVAAIQSHYTDDVRFRSPKATALLGLTVIEGKPTLSSYWSTALQRVTSLQFALDHMIWDADRSELLIVYTADLNGQRNRACELFRFDDQGRVIEGEAMYGVPLA
jgi:hypothetical protein